MCPDHQSPENDSSQKVFAEFMQAQVVHIEKFRRRLSRQARSEVSKEQAVRLWIKRGHAATFRNRHQRATS